jgi:cbb3-type cytochrome oxidase subunit 3
MLKELIGDHGSILPQIALVLFVSIAVFIVIYMFTDRRRGHRERMEAMPLDDGLPVEKTAKKDGEKG